MRISAIETSCDETAIALLEAEGRLPAGRQGLKSPKFKVLKNIVSSQIKIHAPFGGVVPNLAKREHLKNLPIIFNKLNVKGQLSNVDLIAVTIGPGLEPCLWTGINFAKEIHKNYFPKAKLIGVNHLEGHLYSFLLQKTVNSKIPARLASQCEAGRQITNSKTFPAIALIVSGGHTILLLMKSLTSWQKLGETRDDAVGEAFDKVARMLHLPFPGGPEIEKLAKFGNPQAIKFPRPMINSKDYDFSFSGLKTSVLYYIRDHQNTSDKGFSANVCASFQEAVVETLVSKAKRAALVYKAKSIMLAGGVAANKSLRQMLRVKCQMLHLNFFAPKMDFNTDNAAMVGVAAYISYLRKKNRKISAQANLNL